MANFIPEQILEEIQLRSDIVEAISRYIPLKRAGANFKAPCPFHNERTPSFVVSPSKQIFHCFGCGAGGNVFAFVMQYEHLNFVDAVKLLADRAGVAIPDAAGGREATGSRELLDVNKFAAEIFGKWLCDSPAGKRAYSYLKDRCIKDEIIRKLQLGYAPAGNQLLREAEKSGVPGELLKKAGLAVSGRSGLQDMFRERLMFPVFNTIGRVVGFSGRVLNEGLPKYINTPETQIFHKGRVLYGLHISKQEIIKQRQVIICEGYFDFIRLYQEGLRYVVASQGTAFTRGQVHLLRRYTDEIVVSFDGDTAGNKAALAGLEMFLEEGLPVRVITLPKAFDPDSFVREKGIDSFCSLIREAKGILDVKFTRLCEEYTTDTVNGKLKVIGQLLPDIARIKNDIWRREFIKRVAVRLGVPEDSLWIELGKLRKAPRKQAGQPDAGSTIEKVFSVAGEFAGERYLIQLLSDDDVIPETVKELLDLSELQSPEYREILRLVIELKDSGRWKGLRSLMAYIKDEGMLRLISQLVMQEVSCLDKKKAVRDCLYNVKRRCRDSKIKRLIKEMERTEKEGKHDISGLVRQINQLQKELIRLKQDFENSAVALEVN